MASPTKGRSRRDRAQRLSNRGARLLQQGEASKAIHLLERAHQLDAGCISALITLGGAYIVAGRHKEAVPLLEIARDSEPENAMIWTNLGAAYLGNPILATPKDQARAISAFEQALELDPTAPSVYYNLGLIHRDRGDSERAAAAFRQAIQANPFDRDARFWLSKLTEDPQGGNTDES